MRSFHIYYTDLDDTNILLDEITTPNPDDSDVLDYYTHKHPDRRILGFYETKHNLRSQRADLREKFNENCYIYGFRPEDFERTIESPDKIYKLIGFLPKNTKYKVLLLDLYTGRFTKATTGFVKKYATEKRKPDIKITIS